MPATMTSTAPAVAAPSNYSSSTSGGASSVFARLTGRRNQSSTTLHRIDSQESPTASDSLPPLPRPNTATEETAGGKTKGGNSAHGHHRRESSILSLTNSINELGGSVKRSVSLRSHRTTPSNSSSFRGIRSPSAGNLLSNTTTPLESPEEHITTAKQLGTEVPTITKQVSSPPRSIRNGRPSLSVRTLTHKFRSTEALPRFTSPIDAPESAIDRNNSSLYPFSTKNNFAASTSMLVHSPPNPMGGPPGRPAPERPNLPQHSISYSGGRAVDHQQPQLTRTNTIATASNQTHSTSANSSAETVLQQIQETAAKRCATIEYLRRVHSGDVFYFSTFHLSTQSLASLPSLQSHRLSRRAAAYFILGYSLPAVLDLHTAGASPHGGTSSTLDFLKALAALLQEFEAYQSLVGYDANSGMTLPRGRVAGMLKSGMMGGIGSGLGRTSRGRRESVAAQHFDPPPPPLPTSHPRSGVTSGGGMTPSSAMSATTNSDPFHLAIPRSSDPANNSPATPSSSSSATAAFGLGLSSVGLGSSASITPPITSAAVAPPQQQQHHEPSTPIIPPNLEFTHLLTPHLPFEPDFATTLATLCDALCDCYARLASLIATPEDAAGGVSEAFFKADKMLRKVLVGHVVKELEEMVRGGNGAGGGGGSGAGKVEGYAGAGGIKGEIAGLGKVVMGGLM